MYYFRYEEGHSHTLVLLETFEAYVNVNSNTLSTLTDNYIDETIKLEDLAATYPFSDVMTYVLNQQERIESAVDNRNIEVEIPLYENKLVDLSIDENILGIYIQYPIYSMI